MWSNSTLYNDPERLLTIGITLERFKGFGPHFWSGGTGRHFLRPPNPNICLHNIANFPAIYHGPKRKTRKLMMNHFLKLSASIPGFKNISDNFVIYISEGLSFSLISNVLHYVIVNKLCTVRNSSRSKKRMENFVLPLSRPQLRICC